MDIIVYNRKQDSENFEALAVRLREQRRHGGDQARWRTKTQNIQSFHFIKERVVSNFLKKREGCTCPC